MPFSRSGIPSMSKNILIVESDTALSASLRQALEARGFTAQETADGKGSVELIRRERPELVVLAVDLSAGQNGYLICGKLKKDDELKTTPIIITGNPDGFAQHRKLKAHADDYVAKPVNPDELVERVGGLIGFPELPVGEVMDDGLALDGLDGLGEEPVQGEELAELAIEGEPLDSPGDELSMLDNAFGDSSFGDGSFGDSSFGDGSDMMAPASFEEPVEAPPEALSAEEDFSGLDSLGGEAESALDSLGAEDGFGGFEEEEEKTVIGYMPTAAAPAPARAPTPAPVARSMPAAPARTSPLTTSRTAVASTPAAPTSAVDAAELRTLRTRVAELESALEDARNQASSSEGRVHELEAELEARSTELETARSNVGRNDQATFALREAANRKDKEILRLKSELNQKDQEIVELRDKQLELEQQANGASDEIARRDAQLKTLQAKAEQLAAANRRAEQQLAASKEEARGATARASALEAEVEQFHAHQGALQAESEELRARLEQLDAELATVRGEADSLRAQLEQTHAELESVRAQASQESETLRQRTAELEEAVARNEDRVARLYARIKSDEKLRERTKKALAIATQLLEEQPELQGDEEAVA